MSPKKLNTLFIISKSYQEKGGYESVEKYFSEHFKESDICILSSHINRNDIKQMIEHGHKRKYNIGAIFWSNSDNQEAGKISTLNWEERFFLSNPFTTDEETWRMQVDDLAREFAELILRRALFC
jgi:hypothetical protein